MVSVWRRGHVTDRGILLVVTKDVKVGDSKSELDLTSVSSLLTVWASDPSVGETIASASFSLGILVEVWGVRRVVKLNTQSHDFDAVITPVCG